MKVELNRTGLEALVMGSQDLNYNQFDHPLVKKAGHEFIDSTQTHYWDNLDDLTDEELYQLHLICLLDT